MKQLEDIKAKLKAIDKGVNDLYGHKYVLEKEYDKIRESLLLKNGSPLQEDTWTLKYNKENSRLYLDDDNRDGFKILRKLYNTTYHCHHDLFDKCSLIFNDGEMSINTNTNEKLISFIKEYNLKVVRGCSLSTKGIDLKILDLQSAKNTINDIISKL